MKLLYLCAFALFFHGSVIAQNNLTGSDPVCKHLLSVERAMAKKQFAARLADPRLHDYDVTFYFLDLAADNNSTDVEGTVTIVAFSEKDELGEIVLELADELTVSAVTVNGVPETFTHTGDLIVIALTSSFGTGDRLEVSVTYGGTPPSDDGFFSGISRDFGPFNIPVTWTLSEPFNASDWFPVKQVLTDQADSANIYITVPDNLMAAASGILKETEVLDNGRLRFKWETRYQMAYYLISMAIAPYQRYDQEVNIPGVPGPVPIQNFIYDDSRVTDSAIPALQVTPDMLVLFSDLFGPYPFKEEKYGHAMAPMGGGMEHQTISTMAGFNFTLIAHELMHQWFGDDITCATWQDIWINEGFARYGEYLAIENLVSLEDADAWMTNNYNHVLSQPAGSVYVPQADAEDPYRIFNFRLTYNKGGALLHMLRYLIGDDDLFFEAMEAYAANYSGKTVTGDDFKEFMEGYTQQSLTDFFDQWYYGEGYPIYDLQWNQNTEGELVLSLTQETSAPDITPFFSTPLPVEVETTSGTTVYRLEPSSGEEEFILTVEGDVLGVELDPRNIILKKVGIVTSTDPSREFGYRIYPNPAREAVNLEITSGLAYEVSLMDLNGRTLRTMSINPQGTHQLQLDALPSGIYLLQLRNQFGRWTERIEVMR